MTVKDLIEKLWHEYGFAEVMVSGRAIKDIEIYSFSQDGLQYVVLKPITKDDTRLL